jgi:fibroblast growth factor receptor 1
VLVSILNQNATQKSPGLFTPDLSDFKKILPPNIFPPNSNNNRNILPPPVLPQFPKNFHDYGIVGQPEINGGGSVYSSSTPQTKTYPDRPFNGGLDGRIERINATTLRRQPPISRNRSAHDSLVYETMAASNATEDTSTFSVNKPINDAAESRDIPVIPVILVICLIFLIAGIVALVIFRKNLCAIGKTLKKKSKLDQAKKSNQSNGSNATEDSRNSIVMNHWNGPTAFGNRYTSPWEQDSTHQQVTSQLSNGSTPSQVSNHKDRWEFPRHRLKVFNILGEGAFGQVWRCEATDIDGVEGVSEVAVKTLKENAAEAERKDLLSELDVMKSLEPHINVVRLLGCCTEKDPIFVIIEYVNHGKLQSYLRNSRVEK